MKKTLAAVAVLGAFAGSAFAADVTLYGRIDGGFQYNQNSIDVNGTEVVDDSSFKMGSGQSTGSRFGLKGTEELSEGLKAGFVLEHGFNFDNGGFGDTTRMFNREASLQLISDDFGTLALGRMGSIKSDAGTFGFYAGAVNPFGTGWSNIPGVGASIFSGHDSRWDNMITYKSPTFAGTTVYAQYSMGGNDADEMTHRANRYAALGVNYVAGNLYNFGVAKTYLAASYFKNANDVSGIIDVMDDAIDLGTTGEPWEEEDVSFGDYADAFKGYGVALGADVPAFGGNFLVSLAYTDAEEENWDADVTAYSAGVAYTYPLSKRTNLYVAGVYNNREVEGTYNAAKTKVEQDQYQAFFGMVHKF